MALGVEYRTTERYLGKPVYARLFDAGKTLNGEKTVVHNIANMQYPVSCKAVDISGPFAVPYDKSTGAFSASFNRTSAYVYGISDYVDRTVYLEMRYTKTTD